MTTTQFVGPVCDVCEQTQAIMSLMRLDTYDTVKACPGCAPTFLQSIVNDMLGVVPGEVITDQAPPSPVPPLPDSAVPAPDGPELAEPGGPESGGLAAPRPDVMIPAPDGAALAATAGQLDKLRSLGVVDVDSEPCPECVTMTHAPMGHDVFVCPWCGLVFNPRTGKGYADVAAMLAETAARPGTGAAELGDAAAAAMISTLALPDGESGGGQS